MNALEERIAELIAEDGPVEFAFALARLDPEILARHERMIEQREIARIEDLLRAAPDWMWDVLLNDDAPARQLAA